MSHPAGDTASKHLTRKVYIIYLLRSQIVGRTRSNEWSVFGSRRRADNADRRPERQSDSAQR